MKNLLSIICIAALFSGSNLFAQSGYKVVNQIHLEGDGFWDYLSVDEAAGRLYVSHGSMALVVDLKTGKQIGKIPHHLYLSAAEFGELKAGERRPPMNPCTFMVLDVAPVK